MATTNRHRWIVWPSPPEVYAGWLQVFCFARHELKDPAEGLGTDQDALDPAKWRDGRIIRIQRHFYDGWSSGTISPSVHRTRTQRHFLNTGRELSPFLLHALYGTKNGLWTHAPTVLTERVPAMKSAPGCDPESPTSGKSRPPGSVDRDENTQR